MIRLTEVSKSFDGGRTSAVDRISLEVEEGETLVLLGSSGCGKTTTLKMINRLIDPTSGKIELDGIDIHRRDPVELRRSIGYVIQGIGLFPHLTIQENVEMVPRILQWPPSRMRERAQRLLELVGLSFEDYAERLPEELSGGQKQRVGVARALAADPKYLLMDEPFGALDGVTRDTLQKELLRIKSKIKKTIVFVTHDILEAMVLADRIAILHEGKVEQIGTRAEILRSPATDFVRRLFERPMDQLGGLMELQES